MTLFDNIDTDDSNEKLEIRCSKDVKDRWRQMCADLDPDSTYQEVLAAVIRMYEENPDRLERHHY